MSEALDVDRLGASKYCVPHHGATLVLIKNPRFILDPTLAQEQYNSTGVLAVLLLLGKPLDNSSVALLSISNAKSSNVCSSPRGPFADCHQNSIPVCSAGLPSFVKNTLLI